MKTCAKIILVNALVLASLFAAAEGFYSLFAYLTPSGSIWIGENAGQTVRFDPIMGHALSRTPSRTARITRGVIEYIGTMEGNAQGFPDRDDFTVERPGPDTRRYAVFGDSFTAGQFLSRNWPDRAEDMFLKNAQQVQLLNFSGNGWGLANWASVIRGLLRRTPYELDGLIFAVWQSDLKRRFAYADLRGQKRRARGTAPSWDPDSHPRSLEEAMKTLEGTGSPLSRIVSTDTFNAYLKGKPVRAPKWEFVLSRRLKEDVYWPAARSIGRWFDDDAGRPQARQAVDQGKIRLFDEIRDFAAQRNLPILVVYIWSREGVFGDDGAGERRYLEDTRTFAAHIGGVFVDGGEAFADVTQDRLKQLWLPYDGHWGQGGSDVFARFMTDHILALRDRRRDQ